MVKWDAMGSNAPTNRFRIFWRFFLSLSDVWNFAPLKLKQFFFCCRCLFSFTSDHIRGTSKRYSHKSVPNYFKYIQIFSSARLCQQSSWNRSPSSSVDIVIRPDDIVIRPDDIVIRLDEMLIRCMLSCTHFYHISQFPQARNKSFNPTLQVLN